MRLPVGGIDVQALGRSVGFPDQRLGQPVGMGDVVEAEAALDAETLLVGRAIDAVHPGDLVVLDLEGQLAADAAIGADGLDLAVIGLAVAVLGRIHHGGGRQRAGGTGLHALAAGDTGGGAHGIVHVEDDLRVMPAPGHADHVVDLHLAAGADAEVAVDAGIQIDPHRHMAVVEQRYARLFQLRQPAVGNAVQLRHVPEMRRPVMGLIARRLVGHQHFDHHLARLVRPRAVGRNLHPLRRGADTGGRQRAFPFDLDHAGAAIAVGAVAGLPRMAEMRDTGALSQRHLPDRFACRGGHGLAVQREGDGFAHGAAPAAMDSRLTLHHAGRAGVIRETTPKRCFAPPFRPVSETKAQIGAASAGQIARRSGNC